MLQTYKRNNNELWIERKEKIILSSQQSTLDDEVDIGKNNVETKKQLATTLLFLRKTQS